ncbi:hypothetical protein AGMMS49944_05520 [Spirochaetia bacterium]|nr:hypothetical protein AGMMS49944_05520 [Spirochaetia bacterium]
MVFGLESFQRIFNVDTETNIYYTVVKVPTSGRTGREQRRTVHDEFHGFI